MSKCRHQLRKMYYLLVSCSRSRACHIEMIGSRSTSDVMKAFKCFFSRRGYPTTMIADRESSFIRSSKEINKLFHIADKSSVASEMNSYGIEFEFNFSHCDQHQSLAERIHRIVKLALETKLIGKKQYPTDNTVKPNSKKVSNMVHNKLR